MPENYDSKEYWELYKNLPKKIQNLFWEDDISSRIEKITERFELDNERREKLLEIVASVYLGILPPSQIKNTVSQKVRMSEEKTSLLSNEIIRFLVSPLKPLLEDIYEKEEFEKIGIKSFKEEVDKKENNSDFGDVYREPVE